METRKVVLCLEAFDLIELLTHLAPQNDPQYLSFVNDINAVGKNMTRNGPKMAKLRGCLFELTQTILRSCSCQKNIFPELIVLGDHRDLPQPWTL